MAVILRRVFCFALMLSSLVDAQEEVPAAPDPRALEASWWTYFEPTPSLRKSALKARIERNRDSLELMLLSLSDKQRENLSPFVKQINDGLERYANLRELVAAPSLIPPPLEHYSLDESVERFILWRQLQREFELEQGDLEWQRAQLVIGRKHQAKRRSEYLSLGESDLQRLPKAIELMASRINLELASLQNKQHGTQLKVTGRYLQELDEELASIRSKLVPLPGAEAKFIRQHAEVQRKAESLREKAIEKNYSPMLSDSLDTVALKYRSLVNINTEIEASMLELKSARYRMMALHERLLSAQKNEQEAENKDQVHQLMQAVKLFQKLTEEVKQREQFWRSFHTQTRKYVAAQNLGVTAGTREQSTIYQQIGVQIEANDLKLREFDLERNKGDFLAQLAQEIFNEDAGLLDRGLLAMDAGFKQSWDQLVLWMNASLIEINEVPLTSLGLLRVAFIIFLAWLMSAILRRGLDTLGAHNEALSSSAIYTLGRIIHYIVLVLGIVIGLSSIGLDFTKFALFASALGVGIGFGLQNLIGNFVSGLIILFEKSLKVGDFVELSSGLAGEVKEVNMRGTLITTNDNIDIIVPNSDFVNSQVTNWTLRETQRRIHVPFGVAYGTDKDLVKRAVLEAADLVTWTLSDNPNRKPQVWFVQFGDSSLNFELVLWLKPEAVKRPSAVQAAYLWEIDTKLKEYGIEIPFPQRDLHLRSVFGQKDEAGLLLLKESLKNPE